MEANGLVTRTAVPSVPVEVDYALTAHARALWPILMAVQEWAVSNGTTRF